MPPKDAAAQGALSGGGGRGGNRLSGLRDEVLSRVMSHLKAWEAVRTCVLSRRWRNLWAASGRIDIRQPCGCPCRAVAAADLVPAEEFATFVKNLLLRRPPTRRLDSLRLCWSHDSDDGNANHWIAHAVRHGAEEIDLSAEHHLIRPSPEYMSFIISADDDIVKTRLRTLKLTHVWLDANTLKQLCSRCTCLEELELRDCQIPQATGIRSTMLKRLTMIRCKINWGFLVYAPNIVSLRCIRPIGYVPWIENLGPLGIVNIVLHQTLVEYPEYMDLVCCNLKFLQLSHMHLDDTILRQLCSRCTSLEELELKDCSVEGHEIGSTSLKYLTMISCKFAIGFRVRAPNLVLLRCIKPFHHFPQIQKMEFLVTAAIVLDDSCLLSDCQWPPKESDSDDNSNDESDHDSGDNKHNESDGSSNYYDSDRSASSDEDDDDDRTVGYGEISKDRTRKAYKYLINGHKHTASQPMQHCYGKYVSKVSTNSGGVGMLSSLSHVKRMDLLAHPGEVLLTRESKSCTDFRNLKTLSLGEWCIAPGFDVLAAMLRHSPNLENLFILLNMAYNSRVGFNQGTSSFKCTNLKLVNITCCKHDVMVHTLADFFSANSIPNDKIIVRRTACSGCTGGTSSQAKRKAQSEAEKREAKQMKAGN